MWPRHLVSNGILRGPALYLSVSLFISHILTILNSKDTVVNLIDWKRKKENFNIGMSMQTFILNIVLQFCLSFYRESLLKSATWDNVDLIYNGLSDAYETLYPVLDNVTNEGGMRLLKQSQVGNLTVSPFFHFHVHKFFSNNE
jgi:hypothetical protein